MTDLPIEILDHLPDAILLLDADRNIIASNRSAEELLDRPRLGQDLALSVRQPDLLAAVDQVLRGEPPRDLEATLPGNPPRNISVHTENFGEDATDQNIAAVLVITDITASRRSERMRADFVANASHELRSPLSAIIGFLETIAGWAKDDPDAQQRFVEIMIRESQRMTRLIDDLLSLSKVEINEHVRPTSKVALELVIDHVIQTLAGRAAERDIRFDTTLPPDLPEIVGEEEQVQQVLHNLVDNAIKYGNDGSRVEIEARQVSRVPGRVSPGVAIAIRDRSPGIPQDVIPRLTERFFRVDEARSRQMGSTGLGLAICKHIINRHRGHLMIESVPGEGSTFTIYLPTEPPAAPKTY